MNSINDCDAYALVFHTTCQLIPANMTSADRIIALHTHMNRSQNAFLSKDGPIRSAAPDKAMSAAHKPAVPPPRNAYHSKSSIFVPLPRMRVSLADDTPARPTKFRVQRACRRPQRKRRQALIAPIRPTPKRIPRPYFLASVILQQQTGHHTANAQHE